MFRANQIRIISLGEIVTIDIKKTLDAFKSLIASKLKKPDTKSIAAAIGNVLQNNGNEIESFKQGKLAEDIFTQNMITALKVATGADLTINEFDQAWNAKNPPYKDYSKFLKHAINYHEPHRQKIVFISDTNPKDMRHLRMTLERNQVPTKTLNDDLVEIGGIPLHTTYATQQSKAKLIESVIKKLQDPNSKDSALARSMGSVLHTVTREIIPPEIIYIRGVNNIDDPILRSKLDTSNQAIDTVAEQYTVNTIIWKRNEMTLGQALTESSIPTSKYSAKAL